MSIESGNHLTISRINRLLRPLRSKCTALNNLPGQVHINHPGRTTSTARSTCSWDIDSLVPLTIEGVTGSRKNAKSDRSSILADYELKRRIRAVSDAFRNVVYGTFGTPCTERIPSLAGLCSSVIGNNIPVTDVDLSGTDSEADLLDEDDITTFADEIYESIPSHHRRFAVVSHALSLILNTCGYCHALVNVLLDVCLSFYLAYDSQRLLSIVLFQAFIPKDSACLPPIAHPAHATYLVDLHARWTGGSQSSQYGPSPFTTSSFCQGVLSSLSHSGDYTLFAWNEVIKLGYTVGHQDIDMFSRMTDALATFLSTGESRRLRSHNDNPLTEADPLWVLQSKLREWMVHLWNSLSTSWESLKSLSSETLPLLVDILEKYHKIATEDTYTRLSDVTAVLATQILVYSEAFSDRLVPILEKISPTPTSYSKLIEHLCRHWPSEEPVFAENLLSQLELYSSVLCSRNLLRLDASLWACALGHFEKSIVNPRGSSALISRLIDAVDAAEKRCFGQIRHDSSPPITLPGRFKGGNCNHRRKSSGHWEWEEMVECWIRKTPVHKMRKLSDVNQPMSRSVREDGHVCKVVRFVSGLQHVINTSRRTPGSTTHECFNSDTEVSDSGSEDQTNKEDLEYSPSRPRPLKRTRTNFSTLLADAQTNRVVLHSTNRSSLKIPETYIVPPVAIQRPPPSATQAPRRFILSPKPLEHPNFPLSDDSLDLFAVSSPAK
ncbi:hypothetical protein V8B97DRAFT_1864576 [Scleroderma yunnanense]